MANKHDDDKDYPKAEVDDIDFDMDDLDIDFDTGNSDPEKKDRKPIEALRAGIKKGFKEKITNVREMQTAIEKALPKESRKSSDAISDYLSGLSEITNDTVTQVRGDVNKIRQTVAKAIPLVERSFGNNAISNLLKKIAKNKDKEDYRSQQDDENKRIEGEIAEFTRLQAEMIKQQQAQDLLRSETDKRRFESQQDLLYAIKQSVAGTNDFHNKLTYRFYQKNLEIGYRQLLIQRKLQAMLMESQAHQKVALDSIVKNTALPDIVKRNNSELMKDIGLRRVMNFATDKMHNYVSGFRDKFLANISQYVKDARDSFSNQVDSMTMLADMGIDAANMAEEFGEKTDTKESAGNVIGKKLATTLARVVAKAGVNRLDKTGKISAGAKTGYGNIKFLPERLNRMAKEGYTGNPFMDFFLQFVPTTSSIENTHQLSAFKRLNAPAEFDNATRKSIVDIIPGLLSRIHLSVDSIRKHFSVGIDENNLLEWDHDKGRFDTRGALDDVARKQYENRLDFRSVATYTSKIITEIDPHFNLSKTQRTLLAREIMSRLSKREGFKPQDLLQANERWETDMPENMQESIKGHIAATLYLKRDDFSNEYVLDKENYDKLSRRQKMELADRQLRIQENFRRATNTYGELPDELANRSTKTESEIERQVRLGYATMEGGIYRTKGLRKWDEYIQDGKRYQDFNTVDVHRRNLTSIREGIDETELTYKAFKQEFGFDLKGGDPKYPGTVPSLNKLKYFGLARWNYNQWVDYKLEEQRKEELRRRGEYHPIADGVKNRLHYLGGKLLGEERTQAYSDKLTEMKRAIMGETYFDHGRAKNRVLNKARQVRDRVNNVKEDISQLSIRDLKQAVDDGKVKAEEVINKVRETAYMQSAEEIVENTALTTEEKVVAIGQLSEAAVKESWEGFDGPERINNLRQQLGEVRQSLQDIAEKKKQAVKEKGKGKRSRAIDSYAKTSSEASSAFARFTDGIGERIDKLSSKSLLSAISEVIDSTRLSVQEKKAALVELLKQGKDMVSKKTLSNQDFIRIDAGVKAATMALDESVKRRSKGQSRVKAEKAVKDIRYMKGKGRGGVRNRSYRVHRNPTLATEYLAGLKDEPDPEDDREESFYDRVREFTDENSRYVKSFIPDNVKNTYSEFIRKNKEATEDRVVYDIYVKGEIEPRLLASKLRSGEYRIEGRDEPVLFLEDIIGPVYNRAGEVVITTEDIHKGLTNFKGEEQDSYTKSRARRHFDTVRKGMSTTLDPFVWLARGVTKPLRMSMGATNCYLKDDLENPVLTRWGFLTRQYRDEKGNAITRVQDIRGPIYDRNGELILSAEQLQEGLVDKKGRPVKGYFIRRLRLTGDILKGLAKPAIWAGKKVGGFAARYLIDRSRRTAKATGNALFANYQQGEDEDNDNESGLFSRIGGKLNRVGRSIRRGSGVRTIDGVVVDEKTGLKRANNYKDDLVAQDKVTEERMRRYKENLKAGKKEGEKKDGIWEMLKGFFPNIIKLLTGGLGIMGALKMGLGKLLDLTAVIGKGIWSLGGLMAKGIGGIGKGVAKAWRWGKDLVSGGKAAKTATTAAKATTAAASKVATKTAASVATKAATTKAVVTGGKYVAKKALSRAGVMAAGALGGPVGLGIASAIVTALTVWDIVSFVGYWMNRPGEVDHFRLAAYGVNPENSDQAEAMLGFEKWMTEKTKITDKGEVILPSLKDKDLEKVLITFMGGKSGGEYLSENEEAKAQWGQHWESWYHDRFLPTFTRHLTALHRIDKEIKLYDAFGYYTGDLKNGLVLSWLRSAYFKPTDLDNPYEQNDNPFLFVPGRDDESLNINVNNEVVKHYYDIVEKEYRNAEKDLRKKDENKQAIAKRDGKAYQSEFAFEQEGKAVGLREVNQAKGEMYRSTYDLRNQSTVLNKDGSRATAEVMGNTIYVYSDINELDLRGRSVITDIDAIRMRLYGLTNLVDTRVRPLLRLEQYVLPYLKVNAGNQMEFEGLEVGPIVRQFGPDLEWDSSSAQDVADFKLWFEYRFAPVFLNFASLLYQIRPIKNIFETLDKLDETDLYNLALELSKTQVYIKDMEVSIWDVSYTPVKGLPVNDYSGSITTNLQSIGSHAESKVLTEKDPRGENYRTKLAEERKLAENTDKSVDTAKGNGNAGVKKDESWMGKLFGYTTGNTGAAGSSGQGGSYGMGYGAMNPSSGNVPSTPYNPKTTTEMQKETAKALGEETTRLGWSDTEKAMFLGQVDHESNALKTLEENGNYKLNVLQSMFSRGRKDPEGARAAHAKGRDGIFEFIYGGRMGNTQPGDGSKYHGRGPIQVTGKDNYKMVQRRTGINAVDNPNLLSTDPIAAAKSSIAWWEEKKATSKTFRDAIASRDVEGVSKAVNGGTNGLSDRKAKTSAYLAGSGTIQKMMNDAGGVSAAEEAVDSTTTQSGGGYDWRNDPKYANLEKAQINDQMMAGSDNTNLINLKTDNGLRDTPLNPATRVEREFDTSQNTPANTPTSVLNTPSKPLNDVVNSTTDDEMKDVASMELPGDPHPRMIRAAQLATSRAQGASSGKCARFVREALMDPNGGGFPQPEKPVTSAYMYHTNGVLKDWGFKLVGRTNRFKPIVGDVRVWGGFGSHQHGHIHIWNGTNWISDFKENNPLGCGESYRQKALNDRSYNQNDVNVYRFNAQFSEMDAGQLPQSGLPGVKAPIDAPHSEMLNADGLVSHTKGFDMRNIAPPPVSMSEMSAPTVGTPLYDGPPQSRSSAISNDTQVQMSYQDKQLQIAEAQQAKAIETQKQSFDAVNAVLKEQLQVQTEIREGIVKLHELMGSQSGLPATAKNGPIPISSKTTKMINKSEIVGFQIGE